MELSAAEPAVASYGPHYDVREAAEIAEICDYRLAVPDRPILAVAGAVECDSDVRSDFVMLGQGRSDVRMMMLYGHRLQAERRNGRAAEGLGVQIVDSDLRLMLLIAIHFSNESRKYS